MSSCQEKSKVFYNNHSLYQFKPHFNPVHIKTVLNAEKWEACLTILKSVAGNIAQKKKKTSKWRIDRC